MKGIYVKVTPDAVNVEDRERVSGASLVYYENVCIGTVCVIVDQEEDLVPISVITTKKVSYISSLDGGVSDRDIRA